VTSNASTRFVSRSRSHQQTDEGSDHTTQNSDSDVGARSTAHEPFHASCAS
jgi:hypothetical protein